MSSSNGSGSTHIGSRGVVAKHRRRGRSAAPVLMKRVKRIGSYASVHYDPKTGRKRAKA